MWNSKVDDCIHVVFEDHVGFQMKTQQRNDATLGLKQVTRLAFSDSAKTLSKMPGIGRLLVYC